MKVILSRKGMDSRAGGIPSPILPDGTLLSLPIPDGTSGKPYGELSYKGQTYQEIIHQLSPNFDFAKNQTCHLDPDIYDGLDGRPTEWKPAYGQCDASASHLDKMGVGVGDVFLFYGMYRQTEYRDDGTLQYVHDAPILHIIYGYMKVGEILRDPVEIQSCCPWHPHAVNGERGNNRLYIPDAYGTFHYDDKLVLTKRGQDSRRLWALPPFFAKDGISISWQGDNRPILKDGYAELNSASRGQEFVITTITAGQERNLMNWVKQLIRQPADKKHSVLHDVPLDQLIAKAAEMNLNYTHTADDRITRMWVTRALLEAGITDKDFPLPSAAETVIEDERPSSKGKVIHALFADECGCIYCKKFHAIIQLVEMRTPCLYCEKWRGTIQGEGCECEWDDFDFKGAVCVYDHVAEYDRVNDFKAVLRQERLKAWQEKNAVARIEYERRKWGR